MPTAKPWGRFFSFVSLQYKKAPIKFVPLALNHKNVILVAHFLSVFYKVTLLVLIKFNNVISYHLVKVSIWLKLYYSRWL